MPSFVWTTNLVASELGNNPLRGWQFERVPNSFVNGAFVAVMQRCTNANVRASIFTDSQNIQQRSPVQSGGAIGVTPSIFNTPPIEFRASPDDLLIIENDEVGGAVATVDGIINIEPL